MHRYRPFHNANMSRTASTYMLIDHAAATCVLHSVPLRQCVWKGQDKSCAPKSIQDKIYVGGMLRELAKNKEHVYGVYAMRDMYNA